MATPQQIEALARVYAAAVASGCLFPQAQACEVMVETTWLTSELGVTDNNLFGCKQHTHPIYGTVNLPTREFLNGEWVVENDDFVKYPSLADSFADRMNTLRTLSVAVNPKTVLLEYPHYAAALAATTPEDFLTEVSQTWSTDPTRAVSCALIMHVHSDIFVAPKEVTV